MLKVDHLTLATVDLETDPFKEGRIPEPFVAGFHVPDVGNGSATFRYFWGDDCIYQLGAWLVAEALAGRQYLIYAHNGGRFDFHMMYDLMESGSHIFVIGGRIVEARINGGHVLRDSYSIIPIALETYRKEKIDYAKLERHRRERHKIEIVDYLRSDCLYLGELVSAFHARFGRQLTVGATAIKELRALHPFKRLGERSDERFREFYFGGRVQAFRAGVLPGPWRVYDVNSMYPHAMRDYWHPTGDEWDVTRELPEREPFAEWDYPFFIEWSGVNHGAVPLKTDDGLDFTVTVGRFKTTSHELRVALDWGLIEIEEIHQVLECQNAVKFEAFVDKFYSEKAEHKKRAAELKAIGERAAASEELVQELFCKFMLNSCYGKFGQNPDNFLEWHIERDEFAEERLHAGCICEPGKPMARDCMAWHLYSRNPSFELWQRPAQVRWTAYNDVSVAASITGAARAILLDGIMRARDPVYVDTDSIVCRSLDPDLIDPYKLGAWKEEARAEMAAIAGKKLYALYNNGRRRNVKVEDGGQLVKLASKGGRVQCSDIVAIAQGDIVEVIKEAPTFSLKVAPRTTSRVFRKT